MNPGGKTHDVLIVGAGPAGLSLALTLAGLGLRIAVIERQEQAAVALPQDDGREIALTHRSMRILRTLGAAGGWSEDEVAPIRAARVYNGRSARFLDFRSGAEESDELGYLVSNHCIRRELYRRAAATAAIELLFGQRIAGVGRRIRHELKTHNLTPDDAKPFALNSAGCGNFPSAVTPFLRAFFQLTQNFARIHGDT